jgi:aryl-alcohol dehydrogenase-like predicted oxidoreductase
MRRRDYRRKGTVTEGLAAPKNTVPLRASAGEGAKLAPIAQRPLGKTGERLSIIGMGGMLLMNAKQSRANNLVAEAFDRGINYFDVAPFYGDAQQRLGPALEPYRKRSFLACKTDERTKRGSQEELEESLRLLKTDYFDLYQFHYLTTLDDVETVFGPDGAMETFQAAKQAGKVRFLGFSAHSVEAALAAMARYEFDTILFPINFVLFSQANFGPQVLERARRKGMGILALKAMAKTTWPKAMKESQQPNPKCWYQPAALPEEAALGLRWTLSKPITAAVPPGDEKYFHLAMDVAQSFKPIKPDEERLLMERATGVEPIFHLGNA